MTFCSIWIGPENVFVMRSDGTGLRQLTTDRPGWRRTPRFSGDGSRIYFFAGGDGPLGSMNNRIFSIAPDGSRLTQLTPDRRDERWPVPSPVSTRVAVESVGASTIIFDAARPFVQQSPIAVAAPPVPAKAFSAFRWTADGSELFGFLRDPEGRVDGVAAYSPDRGTYRQIVRCDHDLSAYPLQDSRRAVVERADQLFLLDIPSGRQELLLSLLPDPIWADFSISRDDVPRWTPSWPNRRSARRCALT